MDGARDFSSSVPRILDKQIKESFDVMESETAREVRLRKTLGWASKDGRGLTPREVVRLLHKGVDAKHDDTVIPRLLDKIATDTGLKKRF